MKKIAVILAMAALTSCGTIFGGKISSCQKTKPTDGTKRAVRPVVLVADICTGAVWLVIDAVDGGLYVPCEKKK